MSRRLVRSILVLVTASALPTLADAQHGNAPAAAPRLTNVAPAEAAQLDFLIGQWEVVVTPQATSMAARIHGAPTLLGTWKAWKVLDGFGVEDELRIVDRSGNPNSLTHALRLYDAAEKRWTQVTFDAYRGRTTPAAGEWVNGEYWVRSTGRDAEGKPYVQRARFHDITADGFKYVADRSSDGERTWETAVLRMEARRVAASAPR